MSKNNFADLNDHLFAQQPGEISLRVDARCAGRIVIMAETMTFRCPPCGYDLGPCEMALQSCGARGERAEVQPMIAGS